MDQGSAWVSATAASISALAATSAFLVTFTAFLLNEFRGRRARRLEDIQRLMSSREDIAYVSGKFLDGGLPLDPEERKLVIDAIVLACIFQSSDCARALLYSVILRNPRHARAFRRSFNRMRSVYETDTVQFNKKIRELDEAAGHPEDERREPVDLKNARRRLKTLEVFIDHVDPPP